MLALRSTHFFFFNDTATTEIYTLSLHDALPICQEGVQRVQVHMDPRPQEPVRAQFALDFLGVGIVLVHDPQQDRKSTRLNSSHSQISYAVFCLKKKTSRRPARGETSELVVRDGV